MVITILCLFYSTTFIPQIENAAAATSGWSANAFSEEKTKVASERTYAVLLLNEEQWGENVYLQTDGAWGLRASGNWYINSNTTESWILMPDMKQGDIIVANVTSAASSTVNATYSKYSFGTQYAYEVTEDGDVELAFKKPSASDMDYLYGIYAYRTVASVAATVSAADYATFSAPYALDLSGVEAYIVSAVNDNVLTLTEVTSAPANTGLILKGEGNYEIPTAISSSEDVSANLLVGVSTDTPAIEGTYVLQTQKGVTGFYKVEEAGITTVAAGKAYLNYTAPGAKAFYFDNNATAIEAISALTSDAIEGIYTVGGAKVSSLQKGINIVKMQNGETRKVFVK